MRKKSQLFCFSLSQSLQPHPDHHHQCAARPARARFRSSSVAVPYSCLWVSLILFRKTRDMSFSNKHQLNSPRLFKRHIYRFSILLFAIFLLFCFTVLCSCSHISLMHINRTRTHRETERHDTHYTHTHARSVCPLQSTWGHLRLLALESCY